jgi:glucokinase
MSTSAPSTCNEYVIGIDLGQTTIKGGVVDLYGKIHHTTQTDSMLHSQPEGLLERIVSVVRILVERAESQGLPIVGIGMSSTIDVNPKNGCFKSSYYPHLKQWVGFPISKFLQKNFGLTVCVENDGTAATFGEHKAGAGREYHSMLFVSLGTGIGGGAILDGQRLIDSVGSGAYFGHMSINFDGPLCACGNRGCWELYASGSALEKRAVAALSSRQINSILPKQPTGRDIVQAAEAGDQLASHLLRETGRYLGLGLVNLINLFNPELVVLGGGLAQAGDILIGPARSTIKELCLPIRDNVDLKSSELGPYSGLVGAALLHWHDTS